MKNFATVLFAAVCSAKSMANEQEFMAYISKHGKSYKDMEEYALRHERYQAVDAEIRKFNLYESSSQHGHNFMSDFTQAERTAMMGLKNMGAPRKSNNVFIAPKNFTAPTSVNWVTVTPAVVNPVKDQGQCGSCWSFASTAVMESDHAIRTGTLVSLSEQNLVSCSFLQGNLGCNGGWYYYAWNYALTKPLMTESAYPYTSGTTTKSGSCLYDKT